MLAERDGPRVQHSIVPAFPQPVPRSLAQYLCSPAAAGQELPRLF
jgi:hypothetical protein